MRKNIAIILLLAVIGYLLITRFFSCGSPAVVDGGSRPDSTFYWKTKTGELMASLKGTEQAFGQKDQVMKRAIDSLARLLKVKPKSIIETITLYEDSRSDLKPDPATEYDYQPLFGPDCPPVPQNVRKTFRNQWYVATAQIGDSSFLQLHKKDTTTITWKTVREGGLFNRRQYLQLDVNRADTAATITRISAYRVPQKTRESYLGIGGDVIFLDRQLVPAAGITLEKDADRWNYGATGGGAYTDKWRPYGKAYLVFKLIRKRY